MVGLCAARPTMLALKLIVGLTSLRYVKTNYWEINL